MSFPNGLGAKCASSGMLQERKSWLKLSGGSGGKTFVTLEESFRGHYKRRNEQTMNHVALPFVGGKDLVARVSRQQQNKKTSGSRKRRSNLRESDKEQKEQDIIWKNTIDVNTTNNIRNRVMHSLHEKKKNIVLPRNAFNNANADCNSNSETHSSSTSDFLSSETDSGADASDEEQKTTAGAPKSPRTRRGSCKQNPRFFLPKFQTMNFPPIMVGEQNKNKDSTVRKVGPDGQLHDDTKTVTQALEEAVWKPSFIAREPVYIEQQTEPLLNDRDKPDVNGTPSPKRFVSKSGGLDKYLPSPAVSLGVPSRGEDQTSDLLKEYRMVIKWREKQQISLQRRVDELTDSYATLARTIEKDKLTCRVENETLKKQMKAFKQKCNTLTAAHSKKEKNLEKLVDLLETQRLGFQKDHDAIQAKMEKAEMTLKKQKIDMLDLKKKHAHEVERLVQNAAEVQLCAWGDQDRPCEKCECSRMKTATLKELKWQKMEHEAMESENALNAGARPWLIEIELLKCQLDVQSNLITRLFKSNRFLKGECKDPERLQASEACLSTCDVGAQTDPCVKPPKDATPCQRKKVYDVGTDNDMAAVDQHAGNFNKIDWKQIIAECVGVECVCTACGELFSNPKVLVPCGHTFCGECICERDGCGVCKAKIEGTVPNVTLEALSCRQMLQLCTERILEMKRAEKREG
jgi:hypothetical protein